jgi:hypothetical protein
MADEMDRFFHLLQEQSRTLTAQGNTLAAIAQSQQDTHERLFGGNGQSGALQFLATEINDTKATVATHTKQITFWRGGLAVLTFLWGAAVAVAAVVLKRH